MSGYNLRHIADGEGVCREGNADDEHGMCAQCQAAHDADAAYYGALWNGGMREIHAAERDPKAYAESMRDAGRGHLVRHLP